MYIATTYYYILCVCDHSLHALVVVVVVVVLVVGSISTAAMRAYCTLTPQWSSVIHLQRRCTPSGVRDLF
jgi:hypothetical protein